MLDVSRWLAEQGLGHYAEAFAKNGIAGDILRELTDADLKELGLNLGDRKRLLKAIATLPAAMAAQDQAEAAGRTAPRAVARDAERRQLTVLFCDLVGSTELSGRLDPEEMSEVIRAYHRGCAGVIRRWDGYVAKYMGDGVLAYYGWPLAHEDDAERAVRAGLELAKAIGQQTASDGTKLAARIGIATGQVVVGDLFGEGAAEEEAVVGETPNLAARLQALAEPGAVVVSQATRRLLGGLFDLEDLGPNRLKGFAEPLAVWHVIGESRAEGASRRVRRQALRHWSAVTRRSRCCCADGSRSNTARARRSCCPASPESASPGSCASCARGSRASRTCAYSGSARRTTRRARCIP
jgi:class 3 adenylate cyclase